MTELLGNRLMRSVSSNNALTVTVMSVVTKIRVRSATKPITFCRLHDDMRRWLDADISI